LGEALSKLQKTAPFLHAESSVARMATDVHNRLIHGYASGDSGIVWATVQADIPNLRDELQTLLGET
jgi:uncharacterized protein with HEPN domain